MARLSLLLLVLTVGWASSDTASLMAMIPTDYTSAYAACKTMQSNEYFTKCLPGYGQTLVKGVCNTKADLTCFVGWVKNIMNKKIAMPKNSQLALAAIKKACPSVHTKVQTAYKALNVSLGKCTSTAKTWASNMMKDMTVVGSTTNAQIVNGLCKAAKWYNKIQATDATSKGVKASFTQNFKPCMSCLNMEIVNTIKPMIQMCGTNVASCESMLTPMIGSLTDQAAEMASSMM